MTRVPDGPDMAERVAETFRGFVPDANGVEVDRQSKIRCAQLPPILRGG